MSSKKYYVIGISGTTNSGKSTIASMLSKKIPNSSWMCQDSYFYEPDDERVEREENGMQNWEKLSALDMEKMVADVKKWITEHNSKSSVHFLIIEGFIIFNDRDLSQLFDKKYFIKIDKETCLERRRTRTYNPPDCPGYFEEIVWPEYVRNLEDIQDQNDIVYFDERTNLETLCEKMECDISSLSRD